MKHPALLLIVLVLVHGAASPEELPGDRLLPLFDDWFVEQGVELPRPLGIGIAAIFMDRDVEVDDVRVSFGDRPPESIADRADFDVSNSTGLLTTRADAWLLPFLNVYAMAGYTTSEARLRTTVTIPNPGPGDPIVSEIEANSDVGGALFGGGVTAVIGFKDWFGMADANYGESDLDEFDGKLDVWILSGRFGRVYNRENRQLMLWGGLMYIDSERTISIREDLPLLGETVIDVDQRPKDPLTYQLGASLTMNTRWSLLAEIGSNFDDAYIVVGSATYRF